MSVHLCICGCVCALCLFVCVCVCMSDMSVLIYNYTALSISLPTKRLRDFNIVLYEKANGKQFDSSRKRGERFSFGIGVTPVIQGNARPSAPCSTRPSPPHPLSLSLSLSPLYIYTYVYAYAYIYIYLSRACVQLHTNDHLPAYYNIAALLRHVSQRLE